MSTGLRHLPVGSYHLALRGIGARLYPREIIDAYPNLKAYLAKIVERPAFKRALEIGDPGLKPLID